MNFVHFVLHSDFDCHRYFQVQSCCITTPDPKPLTILRCLSLVANCKYDYVTFCYLRQGGYGFAGVGLFVCLSVSSVSNITQKIINGFWWNFQDSSAMIKEQFVKLWGYPDQHLDPRIFKDSLSLRDRVTFSICACNSTINVQGAGWNFVCGCQWRCQLLGVPSHIEKLSPADTDTALAEVCTPWALSSFIDCCSCFSQRNAVTACMLRFTESDKHTWTSFMRYGA